MDLSTFTRIITLSFFTFILSSCASKSPKVLTYPDSQMRADVENASVTKSGDEWNIIVPMLNDNDFADGVLPENFRRWWHFEIANLPKEESRLNIAITNIGYSDNIIPVISYDGGKKYKRLPAESHSDNNRPVHNFQVDVPLGIESIRLAKWYPFTLDDYMQLRDDLLRSDYVTSEQVGTSEQGRPIHLYTITDSTVPDKGKQRVWIHSAVHPAENTAYFTVEGFLDWYLSGREGAELLLDKLIVNLIIMPNPDGNALGNYRTNANGVNIEMEYEAPYDSEVAEPKIIRQQVERFMGTPENPEPNPIKVLLNIHSAHGYSPPFHFVHRANWPENGVTESVRAAELKWVNAFRKRSEFLNQGRDSTSTLRVRKYIEGMMHDRYSIQPQWDDVMAITLEGTYQTGPEEGVPNTPNDYREVGEAMAKTLADYFDISLPEDSNEEFTNY